MKKEGTEKTDKEDKWIEDTILGATSPQKDNMVALLKGYSKEGGRDRDVWFTVADNLKYEVSNAGKGARVKYRADKHDKDKFGNNTKQITALEVLEKGEPYSSGKSKGGYRMTPRERNEILMMNSYSNALKEYELHIRAELWSADDGGWDHKDIQARAAEIARFIKEEARELTGEFEEEK